MHWPVTLTIGVAVVVLRQLGFEIKDPMADALTEWIHPWQNLAPRTEPKLACNLHFSVLRYLGCRDKMVLHNVRLALKMARDNQHRLVPVTDLVQEGFSGLVRAAEKFNFRRGYRFSTYAYNWIYQHIQIACAGNGSLIQYPANVSNDIGRLHKMRMQLLDNSGAEPDHSNLAAATGFRLEKVARLRQLCNITVSLDEPLTDTNSSPLEATLADPDSVCYEASADESRVAKLVGSRLRSLSELEQQVVTKRWGLGGGQALTLSQIADQLNVSSEWVRKLEKAALIKLKADSVLQQVSADLGA
jgi:RNA polymerase sigma factor (sigma-70 family)